MPQRIHIIDSHTGGEPTRTVIAGFPDLGNGPLSERVELLRTKHDAYRRAVILEPRGSSVIVGALLCEPVDPTCAAGVIFFNNVGYLGMCGHGTIGLVETLAFLGRITAGLHRIETPVGVVTALLHEDGSVSVRNISSWRKAASVAVSIEGIGSLTGDVAYSGNWFYLVANHGLELTLGNVAKLTQVSMQLRDAVHAAGFPEVDHVELFGPPQDAANHSRNFVLCPGAEYDRSPCGTGTSAKLACLAADGKLQPGEVWRQESILGSVFEGTYEPAADGIIPTITGRAHITAESQLILNSSDPFQWGIAPNPELHNA